MSKKIIYIDMDGVISDFDKAAKEGGWTHRPDLKVDFRNLELILGAKEGTSKFAMFIPPKYGLNNTPSAMESVVPVYLGSPQPQARYNQCRQRSR